MDYIKSSDEGFEHMILVFLINLLMQLITHYNGMIDEFPWSTFWTAIQAVGVPISVFIAIYLPKYQQRKVQLENLVSNRNIAFTCQRLTECIFSEENDDFSKYELDVEASLPPLNNILLTNIWPSILVEHFIEIQHMALRAKKIIKDKESIESIRLQRTDTKQETVRRNKNALKAIDDELRKRGCSFNQNGYAQIDKN